MPCVKSKIKEYLQQTNEPVSRDHLRSASLDRKKLPKLIQSHALDEGKMFQIYAQSATDYDSATDEEEEEEENNEQEKSKPELLRIPDVESNNTTVKGQLKKSKSFAGQFECEIEDSKLDEKQKTVLAYFGVDHKASKSPSPTRSNTIISTNPAKMTKQTSLTADDILGEEDLHDVEAMFESLLNNTFEEKQQNSQQVGTDPRLEEKSFTRQTKLGSQPRSQVEESDSGKFTNKTSGDKVISNMTDPLPTTSSNRRVLTKQQTWAGQSTVATPPPLMGSPSPSQSEYDTCCDPLEE